MDVPGLAPTALLDFSHAYVLPKEPEPQPDPPRDPNTCIVCLTKRKKAREKSQPTIRLPYSQPPDRTFATWEARIVDTWIEGAMFVFKAHHEGWTIHNIRAEVDGPSLQDVIQTINKSLTNTPTYHYVLADDLVHSESGAPTRHDEFVANNPNYFYYAYANGRINISKTPEHMSTHWIIISSIEMLSRLMTMPHVNHYKYNPVYEQQYALLTAGMWPPKSNINRFAFEPGIGIDLYGDGLS